MGTDFGAQRPTQSRNDLSGTRGRLSKTPVKAYRRPCVSKKSTIVTCNSPPMRRRLLDYNIRATTVTTGSTTATSRLLCSSGESKHCTWFSPIAQGKATKTNCASSLLRISRWGDSKARVGNLPLTLFLTFLCVFVASHGGVEKGRF